MRHKIWEIAPSGKSQPEIRYILGESMNSGAVVLELYYRGTYPFFSIKRKTSHLGKDSSKTRICTLGVCMSVLFCASCVKALRICPLYFLEL